jgi:hypothetical protein
MNILFHIPIHIYTYLFIEFVRSFAQKKKAENKSRKNTLKETSSPPPPPPPPTKNKLYFVIGLSNTYHFGNGKKSMPNV